MTDRRGVLDRVSRQRRVVWACRAMTALAVLAAIAFALR